MAEPARQPLRQRPWDTFLSHAHADKAVVDSLHAWLERAGLQIWYDAVHLPAGSKIASELGRAIAQCRSALIVLSQASVASGWVEDEWNLACTERNRADARDFRVIPVRIEDCELPDFLQSTKWVDLAGERRGELSAWAELLEALSGEAGELDVAEPPLDLYVSLSWKVGHEQALARRVLQQLERPGLRLIGDSPDWPSFSGDRVRAIMRSCAGVLSIIPNRPRSPDDDRLKHFIREARTAQQLRLPLLVVAEQGADLPSDLPVGCRADGNEGQPLPADLEELAQDFIERCRSRPRAGHLFLAVDFDAEHRSRNLTLRRLIQRAAGLRCVLGEQVQGDAVHSTLIQLIRDAVWVLADISGNNLNTCIEAGVARGAGVDCTLVAAGPYRQQPFMLRGMELQVYDSDSELLALAYRAARAYRRRRLSAAVD
ncbi:MAG: toll/interleukin-1 receptor domain-containing protein [Burkholderiales bacterium]|jgi:hypothetical protein|nr:toll/interleukin-1 receptor domain-containing protein [Burkholderiales bacterium]MBP7521180.1 toll/interleukin-1 receptor domain-containing protein [Leptothrix sp. (in: b-proteobacteria)]HQY07559.1 toll/interleukin-1 receptor domain-containing protein [Burkholderiaceae bacterium]